MNSREIESSIHRYCIQDASCVCIVCIEYAMSLFGLTRKARLHEKDETRSVHEHDGARELSGTHIVGKVIRKALEDLGSVIGIAYQVRAEQKQIVVRSNRAFAIIAIVVSHALNVTERERTRLHMYCRQ
jgi:hypothetical protein